MKKIIGIACSGLKRSVSLKLMEEFMRGAAEAGFETKIIKINEDLLGCTGCKSCKTADTFCVRKDILSAYFVELPEASAVVLGFGIYMGYPQGEAWTFMNRHYCLHKGMVGGECRIEAGKKLFPIVSQGAPDNPLYREHCNALLKPFEGWGFVIEEPIIASGANWESKLQEAYEAGRRM